MQVFNTNAAGIDIGSRSHFIAVGQEANQIKEFNVYQSGLIELVIFLNNLNSINKIQPIG
ncbi:hypothetical protein [Flavobacterium marginilacus]|uniref:hypothetical protein n=1 Tax=Flavobacterium marginilacus TaxID=3003256 RepID=UPI00248EAAC7|nr:hypothetical protein [Flavobacterium marginilacus]